MSGHGKGQQKGHTWSRQGGGAALPVSSQSGTVSKLPALALLQWAGGLGGHSCIGVSLLGASKAESCEESREAVAVVRRLPEEVKIWRWSGSVVGSVVAVLPRAIETGSIGRADSMTGLVEGD